MPASRSFGDSTGKAPVSDRAIDARRLLRPRCHRPLGVCARRRPAPDRRHQAARPQGRRRPCCRSKADVNAAQPDGATALAWAAYLGDRETAEALLKAGAKVETADEYGETPLTLACAIGDAALIDKLLKAGANANAARWNGETALMIAAEFRAASMPCSCCSIRAPTSTPPRIGKGQTALMWAAAEGHSDVVKLLIERGANVKATRNPASRRWFSPP